MTTTLGLSFSARSVAKKFVLFALNITILVRFHEVCSKVARLRSRAFDMRNTITTILMFYNMVVARSGMFNSLPLPTQADAGPL